MGELERSIAITWRRIEEEEVKGELCRKPSLCLPSMSAREEDFRVSNRVKVQQDLLLRVEDGYFYL